jgi:predicted DCC family thiol-disulfide oxidoreductase YuxK
LGTDPKRPKSVENTPVPLVLYDGVCGLCNGLVQFILRHDHRGVFKFAPIQGPTGRAILTSLGSDPDLPSSFHVVAGHGTGHSQVFAKSDAVVFVARRLPWPWRMAGTLRLFPRSWRDSAYDLIARTRYRWFGRYDQCLLPQPEFKNRFIN